MKRTMKRAMISAVLLASAVGCVESAPLDLATRDDPARQRQRDLFTGDGFVMAVGARLDGAVGPAIGLAHEAELVDFMDDGYMTTSNITVRGDQGSAMGIFYMMGGVETLEVGEGVRTCQEDFMDPDSPVNNGGVAANFIGCANTGAPEDGWSYDQPADCTDVTITEPTVGAPDGSVATMSILAHWGPETGGGQERTVKATIHLAE